MGAKHGLDILETRKMSSLARIRTPDLPAYSLATISTELPRLVSLIKLHRKNGFAKKKHADEKYQRAYTGCFIMNVPILKPYISATTNPR
jgi:hypothetical protein